MEITKTVFIPDDENPSIKSLLAALDVDGKYRVRLEVIRPATRFGYQVSLVKD